MKQIWEKFSWLSPEFIVEPVGAKSVKIKGVAVPPNIVSKNNRRYVDKEMIKAARTWIDSPITVNHNDYTNTKNRKGKVNWMEFDEADGKMEYYAEVWNPELVNELRLYKRDPSMSRVRGVSIEADYMYNRCAICGKRFYTEEEWSHHMIHEEFVKELPKEPHGIRGRALTVVLSPEEPGCEGTTIELLETAPKGKDGLSCLLETVIKTEKENEMYMTKTGKNTSEKGPRYIEEHKLDVELTEQEEVPVPPCPEGWHEVDGECVKDEPEQAAEQEEHECPEGEHWDSEKQVCVRDSVEEQEDHSCPEGEHWDEEKQACVVDVAEQEEHECPTGQHWDVEQQACVDDMVSEQEEHQCGEGEHWDSEQGKCVANVTEQEEQPPPEPAVHECPTGQHWDDTTGACVVDAEPESPSTMEMIAKKLEPFRVKESAPKLKLGEPFADYTSFEDCVAKNSDKENPEAYCGTIKKQAEETVHYQRMLEAKLNEVVSVLNSLQTVQDDRSWVPRLEAVENKFSTVPEWATVKEMRREIFNVTRGLANVVASMRKLPADDRSWAKTLNECRRQIKRLQESEVKSAGLNAGKVKELHRQITEITAALSNVKTELTEQLNNAREGFAAEKEALEGQIKTLTETVESQKKDFETILETADKNIVETRKTLEERIEALTKEKEDLERKITETAENDKKKLEETADLAKRVDNLEDKQKPEYRAKPKTVVDQAEVAVVNPYKDAG